MDGPTTRRAWSKPDLIVLVRSGPEEAVLDLCKDWELEVSVGPVRTFGSCDQVPQECGICSTSVVS